jgi:MFS family permease
LSTHIRIGRLVQLLLLAAATWVAMYSRSALGPLQETIRASLSLSDNQMALLQGAAMALPMALGSIPLGLLADQVSRARMLSFFVCLSCASCVFSAVASEFSLLFIARCLAGLSSAAILIACFSLIGDLYAPEERGRASMVVASGEIFGAPAAFAIGGTLVVMVGTTPGMTLPGWELADWRWSLLWMAGLLIPIVLLTLLLREPPRSDVVREKPPLRVVWPELWRYRTVAMPVLLARAMIWLADGAVFVWAAPTFARKFDLAPDRVGAMIGVVLLVSGLLGPVLGGPLADFCQRRGGPRQTMAALAGIALLSVPAALFAVMPSAVSAACVLAVFLTLGFTISTAGVTLSIIVIPGELRGFYLGITFTVGSLFFVGLAPLAVSMLSGFLGGEAMIGRALAIVCASAGALGAIVFGLSARILPTAMAHDRECSVDVDRNIVNERAVNVTQ